jgi:hypothetical protein
VTWKSDREPASSDSFTVDHDNGLMQFYLRKRHQDAPHTILAFSFAIISATQQDQARPTRTKLGQVVSGSPGLP